jgi:hypothetical protein
MSLKKEKKQNGVERAVLSGKWVPNNPAKRGVVRHPQARQASYRRGGGVGKCAVCKLEREKRERKEKEEDDQ